MSRIGKQPVEVPNGVQVTVADGLVTVKGPKGTLEYKIGRGVSISQDGSVLLLAIGETGDKQVKSNWGTARSIINSMIVGVTKGWEKILELNGVGYTAKIAGDILTLAVGYSHEVKILIPKGVTCTVERNRVTLQSSDKELVGQIASKIRKVCPPEPYLGKGIKYSDEKVRRKAGKTGKK